MAATPSLAVGYARCHADTNRLLQLILADEVIRGDILDVTEDGAEPLAKFRVTIESEHGVREAFLTPLGQIEPGSLLGKEKMIFVETRAVRAEPVDFVISLPVIGIGPRDETMLQDRALLLHCVEGTAGRFASANRPCPERFDEAVSRLDGEEQQVAFDYIWSRRPYSADEFVCLVDSLLTWSPLSSPSLSLPYAVWEGNWVHGFKYRNRLIASLLPNLFGFSLTNLPEDRGDFEKLRNAWLYWGAVEAYSAEAPESSGTPNPGTPK